MFVRFSKIAISLFLAIYTGVICLNNIIDYQSNFEFVRHVLSMDTTFPGNTLRHRAITTPWVWHVAYMGVIAAEGLCSLLFFVGACRMFVTRRHPASAFQSAKVCSLAGALLGFTVWFFGFSVIGGEWFAMWQSATWNGMTTSFHIYMTMLVFVLFLNPLDD